MTMPISIIRTLNVSNHAVRLLWVSQRACEIDDTYLGIRITQLDGNISLQFVFESDCLDTTDSFDDLLVSGYRKLKIFRDKEKENGYEYVHSKNPIRHGSVRWPEDYESTYC